MLITRHRYSRSVLKGEYDGGEIRLSLSLIGKSFLITFFLFPATTSRRPHVSSATAKDDGNDQKALGQLRIQYNQVPMD